MTMSTICFETRLTPADSAASDAGVHAFLALPKSAHKALSPSGPASASVIVEGSINGFPFRARVEPDDKLGVSKAICKATGVNIGDSFRVEITRVGDEAETRLPAELHKALKASPASLETWQGTTPLARRDWILWIVTAKKPETRLGRIEKACDMLAGGKRRVCCFPGLNWMTRDHVAPEETWMPLPRKAS